MTMHGRWGVAALLALAACGGAGGGGGVPDADPRLDGAWTAEFRLTSPLRLASGTASADSMRGQMVLLQNRTLSAAPGLAVPPTHYGAYAADFQRFALPAPVAGRVPTVAARLSDTDSVTMVMDGVGTGVLLTGRMNADSVAGRWWYTGDRAGGAEGTFVLRRARD